MAYDIVIDAIADGTRRRLLEQLRTEPLAVGQMAARLGVTQPAVSQHLRVLEHARLVSFQSFGRRKVYSVSLEGLAELREYLEDFWDGVLRAFAAADTIPPQPPLGQQGQSPSMN
jgi:DNA-binding transcriptional ArsR family regulator